MTENKKICRICLSSVSGDACATLDETKLQILKLISPSTDVPVDANSVLCRGCSASFQKSFDFKTTCLNNDIYLKSYQYEDEVKLSLREIVRKAIAVEPGIKTEYETVCRLCLEYFDGTLATDLGRIDDDYFLGDMIEKCLPEINLNLTRNPLMCPDCTQSLQNQFNLVSTLLDTNDKINDYVTYTDTTTANNNWEVDLRNVLNFTETGNSRVEAVETDFLRVKVKKEPSDDCRDAERLEIQIKVEENPVIKEEDDAPHDWTANRSLKNELEEDVDTARLPIKKTSLGVYSCHHCRHETVCKASLVLHLLTHNAAAPVYKCGRCDFTTKWRTSLTQHAWLHDEAPEMHRCPHCPYQTRYKKHLKRHGKRHKPEVSDLHRCRYCRFTTADKSYFKLHNRKKHDAEVKFDDEKSFRCRLCDFTTVKKSFLTKHCKKSHCEAMYGMLVCGECGFQARNLWRLNEHKLRHVPEEEAVMLQCAKCEFKTRYKNSLQAHLRRQNCDKTRRRKQKS